MPEERNFGQWVAHVADLQAQFCGGITGDTKQLAAASKTTKSDLVAALKDSFAMCDAAYDGTTAANATTDVQTFRGPRPRVCGCGSTSPTTKNAMAAWRFICACRSRCRRPVRPAAVAAVKVRRSSNGIYFQAFIPIQWWRAACS